MTHAVFRGLMIPKPYINAKSSPAISPAITQVSHILLPDVSIPRLSSIKTAPDIPMHSGRTA